jgi:hypothetical protein
VSWIDDTKKSFEGAPDAILTIGLLAGAGVLILVALFAHPLVKAAALAWVVLP